jgi:transposase InsO family protein
VIRKHNLYPDPEEHKKKVKKRKKRKKKDKTTINNFNTDRIKPGKLWHTDTIILWWYGQRRVIFTALEDKTKLGFARAYPSGSSRQAADFLKRLIYLSDSDIKIIHSDNGSEFAGEFEKACLKLGIKQVYNRVRTPTDNPALERFNWTVQDEWLTMSEVGLDDIKEGNQDLTEWLIEYNSIRPHKSLDYQTPLEYAQKNYFKVLPMWSART